MTISQCIRWLEEIKAEHGDIDLLLPDGTPWKKIDVVAQETSDDVSQPEIYVRRVMNNGLN